MLDLILDILKKYVIIISIIMIIVAWWEGTKFKKYRNFAYMFAAIAIEWLIFSGLHMLRNLEIITFTAIILNAFSLFISTQTLTFIVSFMLFIGTFDE